MELTWALQMTIYCLGSDPFSSADPSHNKTHSMVANYRYYVPMVVVYGVDVLISVMGRRKYSSKVRRPHHIRMNSANDAVQTVNVFTYIDEN